LRSRLCTVLFNVPLKIPSHSPFLSKPLHFEKVSAEFVFFRTLGAEEDFRRS